jgi:hypothetical protein
LTAFVRRQELASETHVVVHARVLEPLLTLDVIRVLLQLAEVFEPLVLKQTPTDPAPSAITGPRGVPASA